MKSMPPEEIMAMSGVMPAIRSAMREVAGAEESEGRKMLVDHINELAQRANVKLTGGNSVIVSKATLDKWLSPSDTNHPPSLLAVLFFCKATGSLAPLRAAVKALGVDLMTVQDRRLRDYAQAIIDEKEARLRKEQLEKEL